MAKKPVVFIEVDFPEYRPFTRFRSIFSFRDGIYNTLERARLTYPDREFVYFHPHAEREALIADVEGLHAYRAAASRFELPELDARKISEALQADRTYIPKIKGTADILTPAIVPVLGLLERIPERLAADLEWWLNAKTTRLQRRQDLRAAGTNIVGDPLQLFVHESAKILPGSVFDTRGGPIIIDRDVHISPFSYLEGPVYAGPGARLDNLRLTGGSVLGPGVRAGGEIENSIFDAYSNKHHEGFVGHSILGRWVNLGALTTTSDLKNNYGSVRLQIDNAYPIAPDPAPLLSAGGPGPDATTHPVVLDTGTIKFGSLIGDCVKTAIGTLLNTGTVLDAGANVFGGSPPKYLPPLAWGLEGRSYDHDRFLADCAKIFARRDQIPPDALADLTRLCL